ncbi:MAG: hypothetical protein SWK90_08900 [Chloroflexota bacterium]|nr:hypothetical protein [Chloroflexota bacterium]
MGYGDAASLRAFLDEYPEASGGLLLYGGKAIRRLGEKIVALPWTQIAQTGGFPRPGGPGDDGGDREHP